MADKPYENLLAGEPVPLPEGEGWQAAPHIFEQADVLAAKAAFAAGRPLLLRGEPGTGKTQFARAVAETCNFLLVPVVINGATELEDLFWRYDAVARLGDAQVMDRGLAEDQRSKLLDQRRYLIPGSLWWAFNWESAKNHFDTWCEGRYHLPGWCGKQAPEGVVLLIDEIDKADPDLPNGLLEAFGRQGFSNSWLPDGGIERADYPLLSLVTTNEERELPRAFLRRCLVREIVYPSASNSEDFSRWFTDRARAHFTKQQCSDEVLEKAVDMIRLDRQEKEFADFVPGLAEYLDLLMAVSELHPKSDTDQLAALEKISQFVLTKQSSAF